MTLDRIAHLFQASNLKWKFKDGYKVPTVDDISDAVFKAIDTLADEPDLTQLEFGRLIVQKSGQFYEVYMHMAEFPIGR